MIEIVLFVLIAAISYIGVYLLMKRLRAQLDVPNERSLHKIPTPRGGGLLIAILTVAVAIMLNQVGYALAGAGIALLGWLDDRMTLSAKPRLLIQTGLASVMVPILLGAGQTTLFSNSMSELIQLMWLMLLIVWVVALTNIYNFMDGIDGIAGGVALVGGVGFFLLPQNQAARLLGLTIAASSLGFLGHNWSPARIFMGDVGSTFLGFSFAVLTLMSGDLILGALILWVFIFDSTLTIIRRLLKGENILNAHRTHLYQRLVLSGYSHRAISTLYIGFTVIGVFAAWLWSMGSWVGVGGVIVLAAVLFIATGSREHLINQTRQLKQGDR